MSPAVTVSTAPKKKFQVVPVPGEFTRGRWKCSDTRGGSTMGVFGNYPKDNEFGAQVSVKNDVITVRQKFERSAPKPTPTVIVPSPTPAPASTPIPPTPEQQKIETKPVFVLPPDSHITVVSKINKTSVDSYSDLSGYSIEGAAENEVFVMSNVPVFPAQMVQIPSDTIVINSQHPPGSQTSNPPSHVSIVSTSAPSNDDGKAANTVVAIDNKIVQAMDLVKTHLTFAVREEVETLRTTILELENRLACLREENRVLRDHVSPDVLAYISTNIHGSIIG